MASNGLSADLCMKIVQRSPDAIITINLDGFILSNNSATENIFQYDRGELIGKKINILMGHPHNELHGKYLSNYYEKCIKYPNTKNKFSLCPRRLRAIKKDGSEFPMQLTVIETGNNKLTGIIKDLTLTDENEKIKIQDLEEKNMFATNISHELRTPLNSIINMSCLQRENLKSLEDVIESEKYEDIVENNDIVIRNCTILQTLINDILDFTKLDAGKVVLRQKKFSIRECLEICIDIHGNEARSKGIEFNVVVDPMLPDNYIGDHERFTQIMLNLLSNAVKFTFTGGVMLTVSQQKPTVPHNKDLVTLLVKIKDTGIGVDESEKDKLFRQFTQLNNHDNKSGGTGLGLAICKKICNLMGGDVWLESSKRNVGSTFTFKINLMIDPNAPKIVDKIDVSKLSRKKVLIVDDDENNIITFSEYLMSVGMTPTTCSSGRAALVFVKAKMQFDAAIIDYKMPNMNGLKLGSRMRKLGVNYPMVCLSSEGYVADNSNVFDDIVDKPITKTKLIRVLYKGITGTVSPPISPVTSPALPEVRNLSIPKSPLKRRIRKDSMGPSNSSNKLNRVKSSRIAVIEDNRDHQILMVKLLKQFGYTDPPDLYNHGKHFITNGIDIQYDLIFIDIQMPIMGGLECTKIMREKYNTSKMKHPILVALTAVATYGEREFYVQDCKFDEYLSKPLNIKDLKSILEKYLK